MLKQLLPYVSVRGCYERSSNYDGRVLVDEVSEPKAFAEEEFNALLNNIRSGAMQNELNLFRRSINNEYFIRIIQDISGAACRISRLSLRANLIGDAGIAGAVVLLQADTKLVAIDLSYNCITDVGVAHLLQILNVNFCIVELNLDNNLISESNLAKLCERVERNKQIQAERQRYCHYVSTMLVARNGGLSTDVARIALDYCNGASAPEARAYVARTLYEEAIKFTADVEKLDTKRLFEKLETIFQGNNSTEEPRKPTKSG